MSEFLAEAQVLIRPNTATFAATLKAQLEAAVAAAGPVVVPITAAPAAAGAASAAAAETAIATTAVKTQTAALTAEAAAAEAAAGAQATLVRAERASAVAHSQATRGLAAETLALTGLRGATLAASGPFLIGATAAILFSKSIKTASDETEALNKSVEVFGDSADQIEKFSRSTARSLGISRVQALESASVFGNLFRSINFSEEAAADMSERFVRLASDLASFNNASPEESLEKLRAGLVGQARPLRTFGVFLSQARAQQEALITTGKKSVKALTDQELVQARFNIILQDTALAQGDFARTSDRLANSSRTLKAQLSDLGGSLGRTLLPGITNVVGGLSNLVRILEDTKTGVTELGDATAVPASRFDKFRESLSKALTPGKLFLDTTDLIADALDKLAGNTTAANQALTRLPDTLDAAGRAAAGAAAALVAAQQAVVGIGQSLNALEVQQLQIQTGLAPGGRAAEEANLREQIQKDKEAIALSKSGTQARREALLELKRDQDDLAALLAQDASDAQDRADKIKQAADAQRKAAQDAAQAQADATQAFIDSFSRGQQRRQNQLTEAQLSGSAARQIALNKKIIAADKAEIAAIKERIRHLQLHGQALKIAQAAIAALNQEIFNTRNAILQLQAERRQALVDARQQHLEAQLAIAETTQSTKDDTAAEKALIKFDQAQIRRLRAIKRRRRLTLEEAAQLDAYRVDLAQRNQALKDIKTEVDNTSKRFKELTFSFLQQQQGFATNLLGNLIPGFATAGLVGGQQTGLQQAVTPPSRALSEAAAVTQVQGRGLTQGQGDTQIAVLRQIRDALFQLTGRTAAPEARYQRDTQSAFMDVIGT